jgi:hypothetical protein
MFKRVSLALLACALFTASGCDTIKPYWKSTRQAYKEYVNVDPTIDLKDTGNPDPSERKLADLFTPVDQRLEFLMRALSAQDTPPTAEWCQSFMDSFPWLSGMALLNESGSVSFKLPAFDIKPVDFTPLMEQDKLYKARKMAAYVATTELGAEVMIAKPLYVENDFKGLLVAHFDPGSLAKFAPEPGKLMMFIPGTVLAAGEDSGAAQTLATLNWKNILKSDVSGEQRLGGVRYLWQSRYLGQISLIYAVSAAAAPAPTPKVEPQPATTPATAPAQ